jgi:hypothetical protein
MTFDGFDGTSPMNTYDFFAFTQVPDSAPEAALALPRRMARQRPFWAEWRVAMRGVIVPP